MLETRTYAVARGNDSVTGERFALFPWWSITKTVLAAATLRLVEQGRLSLDGPYKDRPFTIRQLLQHTSGLTTYGSAPYQAAVAAGEPAWPVAELLTQVKADRLMFEPGKGWAYSNIGYLFIRQLIEEVCGRDIDDALRMLVFQPMGISRTRIAKSAVDLEETVWGNSRQYDPGWVYHGLLIGPPADAVDFLHGLFSKSVLSETSMIAMTDTHALGGAIEGRPWTRTGYGLGLMIGEMGAGGNVWGHTGGGPDSASAVYRFPELPGVPIVATFTQGAPDGAAEHAALKHALAA